MDNTEGSGEEGSPDNNFEVDRVALDRINAGSCGHLLGPRKHRKRGSCTRSAVRRLCPHNRSNDILAGERFSPAENCNSRLFLKEFLHSLYRDVDTSDPVGVVCSLNPRAKVSCRPSALGPVSRSEPHTNRE